MNATLAAAAIGVGGTVIVGVAGLWAGVSNTRRTLTDARESRFWEKQTVAYEEALAELAKRRVRRERLMRNLGTASTKALEEFFAERDAPAWFSAEAMLLAYSSKKVLDALDKARDADRAASESLDKLREARQDPGITELVDDDGGKVSKLRFLKRQSNKTLLQSAFSDEALIEAIRAELQATRRNNDS